MGVPVRILGFNFDPNYGRDIERDYTAVTTAREMKVCSEAQPRWDAVWNAARSSERGVSDLQRTTGLAYFYDFIMCWAASP